MSIPFNERRALDDTVRKAEGQNLVNIDHAREARRRFLTAEQREERGLPGPAIAICFLVAGTLIASVALYYGSAAMLWLALVIGEVMR